MPIFPTILFPSQPHNIRQIDECFLEERSAAEKACFETGLVDLSSNAPQLFSSKLEGKHVIYRGWMMSDQEYNRLYYGILKEGATTSWIKYEQYRNAHAAGYLYALKSKTPKYKIILIDPNDIDWDSISQELTEFGSKPIMVKDFVKSQKYYWDTACFIPDASDRDNVKKIVTEFLRLQGESFDGGLVFREVLDLKSNSIPSKNGYAPVVEVRVFCKGRNMFVMTNQLNDLIDLKIRIPSSYEIYEAVNKIDSPFFTVDIAFPKDGSDWTILEVGDGHVSGIYCDPIEFYEWLFFTHDLSMTLASQLKLIPS